MLKELISIDQTSKVKLYVQLFQQIKDSIESGKIKEGSKLPSVRNCSDELNISRNTVTAAYKLLEDEHYAFTKPKSGFIATLPENLENIKQQKTQTSSSSIPTVSGILKSNTFINNLNSIESEIDTDDNESVTNSTISTCCFPIADFKNCLIEVLKNDQNRLDTQTDPFGEKELRRSLALYLLQFRKISSTANQIIVSSCITTLLQQTISSILSLIPSKNKPTGKGLLKTILESESRTAPVKLDIAFINKQTAFSTSVSDFLSKTNFKSCQINSNYNQVSLEKIIQNNIHILVFEQSENSVENELVSNWLNSDENNYLIELNINKNAQPQSSIKSFDNCNRIIYISTFEELISPSLKTAFAVLPQPLLDHFKKQNSTSNAVPSKIEQFVESQFISTGMLEKFLTGTK